MESRNDIIIKNAGFGSEYYDGLKELWCRTFGDEPEFVDAFYNCFGDDIDGYVITDENGAVCSAITCYPAGCYNDQQVFVSYAICTSENHRGEGLASALTEYVKEKVIFGGGISILSPAEPSLEDFYAALDYEPVFYAAPRAVIAESFDDELDEFEFDEEDDFDIVRPEADIQKIDASLYNRYREAYLAEIPHIAPADKLLDAAALACEGFYAINGGDAVCCVAENRRGQLILSELIISPVLLDLSGEIDSELAQMLAKHFDAVEVMYNLPGAGHVQSMAAGISEPAKCCMESEEAGDQDEDLYTDFTSLPYFGFPID